MNVIPIRHWPRDTRPWDVKLQEHNFHSDRLNIIIFDEAQSTYWDHELWNEFFKSFTWASNQRVVLFASYGSPKGLISLETTSMVIPALQLITLRPVDHGDGVPSAGLFLTDDEYEALIRRRYDWTRFTPDFFKFVQDATAGHVGAVINLIDIVMIHQVSLHFQNIPPG